jgi:hypothetical protein
LGIRAQIQYVDATGDLQIGRALNAIRSRNLAVALESHSEAAIGFLTKLAAKPLPAADEAGSELNERRVSVDQSGALNDRMLTKSTEIVTIQQALTREPISRCRLL